MYGNASKIAVNATCGNNISVKLAYLMFTLRYFDVSGFLEVVWSHLDEFYVLTVGFP